MGFKKAMGRLLPPVLRHIPRNQKWLYPFYLTSQVGLLTEEVALESLPPAFDGLRVAYASDIHFGPYLDLAQAQELVKRLHALQADLILLGGDYGARQNDSLAFFEAMPPFSAAQGVFAVLGNHDYSESGESTSPLLQMMSQKGVAPLVNQTVVIKKNNQTLCIAGPDDIRCGQPDLDALQAQTQGADFVLFLPHSPDLIPDAFAKGFHFDLALCGHTHGGQITLFGRSLHSSSIYKDRFRAGWYRENNADIFVSSGVGVSILPMRLGTRPEIHLFTLRSKTKA